MRSKKMSITGNGRRFIDLDVFLKDIINVAKIAVENQEYAKIYGASFVMSFITTQDIITEGQILSCNKGVSFEDVIISEAKEKYDIGPVEDCKGEDKSYES